LENESLRLDILKILYSIRNRDKYISYKKLKDRLVNIDNSQLITELITLNNLRLIDIKNSLIRFLASLNLIGVTAITTEGEAYFKRAIEWNSRLSAHVQSNI